MPRCRESGGILFNHRCDTEAEDTCHRCQKPICSGHRRHHNDQPVCIACVRGILKERRARNEQGHSAYDDDPYFYFYYVDSTWGEPYDEADYALFDGGGTTDEAASDVAGWEGS